ncbi:uncharacterized protein [Dysidea avara]|uniref:uncharacterized protein n=1 Tax=Dysidea avara TaxID=196820 RepID=UPI003327B298
MAAQCVLLLLMMITLALDIQQGTSANGEKCTTSSKFYLGYVPLFGSAPSVMMITNEVEPVNYNIEAPVTGYYTNGTMVANSQNSVLLPQSLSAPSYSVPNPQNNASKEGIYLMTTSKKVSVIGQSSGDTVIDTFFALPTNDLCINEYVYYAVSVGSELINNTATFDGSVVIVGTENETTVTVTVPVSAFVKINNTSEWLALMAGQIYSYKINRLQIMYVAAKIDLTGTKVVTSKPVSVFSGHECAWVANKEARFCDHLVEQMLPTELWGRVYYITPLETRDFYIAKIIAAYDFTHVQIECHTNISNYKIDAGEFVTVILNDSNFCTIYSNTKILVAQLSQSRHRQDQRGDPMMILIPPKAHYTNTITSSTLHHPNWQRYKNIINIVVVKEHYQPEKIFLTVGGIEQSLEAYTWIPIVRNDSIEAYATQIRLNISDGVLEVTHNNESALLTVVVYGFLVFIRHKQFEGYGHPGWLMGSSVIRFSQSLHSVSEGDGFVWLMLILNNPLSTNTTIQVLITGEGTDYNFTPYNVTVPAGVTNVPFNIPIIDDDVLEDNKYLHLTIDGGTLPCGFTVGNVDCTTVVIVNNDFVTVCFNQSTYSVDEDDGPAQPVLVLSNPSSTNITVQVRSNDITATGGVDYDSGPYTVTFPAGVTKATLNIPIKGDHVLDENQNFSLTLNSLSLPNNVTIGNHYQAVVTIKENDFITMSFNQSAYSVDEDDGPAQPVLVLSNPSSTDITVEVRSNDITATGGVDYDSGPYTVTFPAGVTSIHFNVTINDDFIVEGDEHLELAIILSSPPNNFVTINDHYQATVIIKENDYTGGCNAERDNNYGIFWSSTRANTTVTTACPSAVGNATRLCSDGKWDNPVVIHCVSDRYNDLRNVMLQMVAILANRSYLTVSELYHLTANLSRISNRTAEGTSEFPSDLLIATSVLKFSVNAIEDNTEILSSQNTLQNIADSFSNIISPTNAVGWKQLQEVDHNQSQILLKSSEKFGLLLAVNLDEVGSSVTIESENIVTRAELSGDNNGKDIYFPDAKQHHFNTSILIPASFIHQQSVTTGIDPVPVVSIVYKNIGNILPNGDNISSNIRPVSEVISSQVTNSSVSTTSPSNAVQLIFQYNIGNSTNISSVAVKCGYWNFSLHEGRGGWDTEGVTTISVTNNTITCNSSHLTSFAVLVDVSGGHKDISKEERSILSLVSYVGCGVSIICLLVAITILVYYSKTLTKGIHNFVHINLSVALLLALAIFVGGIETAKDFKYACKVVAALLHYFFTAVFTWMLCEGIMLYFLLVKVFNTGLGQKKWFYLAIGWGIPLLIVAITGGVAYDQYGHDEFCWIKTDKGTIWSFVAPMLAVIIVNIIFLLMALSALYDSQKQRMSLNALSRLRMVKNILKATSVLLPLLGFTWVFGILAVNQETSVFAWIFTVLNSLQGLFILFFHVIRNEKIWEKITGNKNSHGRRGSQISRQSSTLRRVNSAVTETFSCAASETKTSVCNKNSVLYSGYDASTTKSINEDSITELGDQLHPGNDPKGVDTQSFTIKPDSEAKL